MTDQEILDALRKRLPPAIRTLNGEVVDVDSAHGKVTMRFRAVPEFCHSGDIVQGGFITGMLDTAMAHAAVARSRMSMAVPTLELKVSFFQPGRPGLLRAEGRVLRWGKSIAFLESDLYDEAGAEIARASSTVKLAPLRR